MLVCLCAGLLACGVAPASTITMVPVFEPISLHGTDGDEAITEIGEALQACVMSRPMALTGAFPEALVEAIRSPQLPPTNHPNYKVRETNLLVICNIGVKAVITTEGLTVRLNIAELKIPQEIDLTARQILKLAIVAIRKTLQEYQKSQNNPLDVTLVIEGADDGKATLTDLAGKFTVGGAAKID